MTFSSERPDDPQNTALEHPLSTQHYNLVIGGCILYGILLNMLIVILFGDFFTRTNPLLLGIAYVLLVLWGVSLAESDDPKKSFLGYNMVVIPIGALIAALLPHYALSQIRLAAVTTTLVVLLMLALATAYPSYFSGLGKSLFITLLIAVLTESGAILLGFRPSDFNWIFVILFTLYIAHDWYNAQSRPKNLDNAIDAALRIYMDIIHLFLRILRNMNKKR